MEVEIIEKIKETINNMQLIFTKEGEEINKNIGIIEIYKKQKKNLIIKNRLEKNRVKRLKKDIRYQTPMYYINLRKLLENLTSSNNTFEILNRKKHQTPMYYVNLRKLLKTLVAPNSPLEVLQDVKIKVMNIFLLPNYEYIAKNEMIEEYFSELKEKLKKKKNYYFIFRQSKVYHSVKIEYKNNNYSSKKKMRMKIEIGDDFNRNRKKYVKLKRIINRDQNLYGEIIIDKEKNEIIRECYELLTEHRNRGNAKYKNKKIN